MPDLYECMITENKKLNEMTFAMSVKNTCLAEEARAGQFLHIKCGAERLLRRPVSICDIHGDTIDIVFEVKGEGTKWLSERRVGYELDILGPLGKGFSLPDGDMIVIGGGIGVPPLLYAARCSARRHAGRVTAVLVFRVINKIILKKEFENVSGEVYITTDDGSCGIKGSVTLPLKMLLETLSEERDQVSVLSCGPAVMLKAVAELCAEFAVPCQVSMEERMGCGVGACLVCACATTSGGADHMSRVCIDGPVFDAAEVVW